MMRIVPVLSMLLLPLSVGPDAGQATPPCRQPLARIAAPERSYANVNVREFDGRVYLYVPEIKATSGQSFSPFALWVVEGIYGRPLVEASGPMDDAAFDRLRKNRNVRATPLTVSRSGETLRATMARQPAVLEVGVAVAAGGSDGVRVNVCPGR